MTNPVVTVSEAVYQAVSDTFEGMAFLELARDKNILDLEQDPFLNEENDGESDADPGHPRWVWARVDVSAPIRGTIAVVCPQDLAQEVTFALYGTLDEFSTETKLIDTMNEIVNTIAGRCMNAVTPEDSAFALGLPVAGYDWPTNITGDKFAYITDDDRHVIVVADLSELKIPAA